MRAVDSPRVQVTLDATPLLGRPTGVGRYVEGLVQALAARSDPPGITLAAFTWRGAHDLPQLPGVRLAGRRVPARALQALWRRTNFPPVEWITGAADVVHGTNFVLPPRRRARGVLTIHDLAYLHEPASVNTASLAYRTLVPRALAAGAIVVTPSQATADDVVDAYGLAPDRIVVTPLGIDPAWRSTEPPDSAWRAARGLPDRYLIAVGNLEPRKNLQLLVHAHAELTARDAETPPLVLAGPPGWGEALEAGPRVHLIGYRETAELRHIVAGAELLAFPSLREGFGLPPLEALACGVPVVASDLPVTREVLGDAATLVPPGNLPALVEALTDMLTGGRGDEHARAARQKQTLPFTWERCAARTMEAYTRAVRT